MLSVRDLSKTFPARRGDATVALDRASLEVESGSFATVLGPSGSGKTTLLRCIAGFENPSDGAITLAGRTLNSPTTAPVRPHSRGIGIVPQEGALFPHLSVARNIAFGLTGTSRSARRDRVDELLDLIGLSGLGDRRPHQLSGGQQQRVALARALAPEPKLILLDEPFSALDAKLRVELREEVHNLLRRVGATAMLVTHDQSEALAMADHLIVIRDGRIVAADDPRDVYDRPPDLDTGRFLGDATVLPGQALNTPTGAEVDCALGRLSVDAWHGAEGPCQVLIRPEELSVEQTAAPDEPGAIGVVEALSYHGADLRLHVALDELPVNLTVRVPGRCRYAAGDRVRITTAHPVCTFPAEAS